MANKTLDREVVEKETLEDVPDVDKKAEKKALKEARKAEKRSKKKSAIFPIVVILLLLGGIGAIIGFDAFKLRSTYLDQFLQNIPIVNNLISTDANEEDPLANTTKEDLAAEVDKLTKQLEAANTQVDILTKDNANKVKTIENLQVFEAQQTQFNADKAAFDEAVALNDPNAYAKFYESIEKENAEKLYKEVVATTQVDKKLKNYVSAYTAMDASAAAKIFEEMIRTDNNLVTLILQNMDADTRGEILSNMTPANAATVTKLMSPN